MTKQISNILTPAALRAVGFVVVTASMASFSGLYGTNLLGWPLVWFFWAGLIGLGMWLGAAITAQVSLALAGAPAPVRWLAASAAISVPMCGLVVAALTLVGHPVPPERFIDLAGKVFVVTAAITGARSLQRAADSRAAAHAAAAVLDPPSVEAAAPAPTDTASPPRATLVDRLPQQLKAAEIWALSAEDHYVRVHTALGSALILMRLTDAVACMAGVEGARVHRSWWVARAGVKDVRRRTEGGVVTLKDGTQAPVSRRHVATIEALAWPMDRGTS